MLCSHWIRRVCLTAHESAYLIDSTPYSTYSRREIPGTMMEEAADIAPSELGTKTYWDSRYELELQNFQEYGDEGEIWFGRSAENRILEFLKTNVSSSASILDLGCGNGSVLRRLRKNGFLRLTGVDYCPNAIKLARRISEEENHDVKINFEVMDILSQERNVYTQYDVILDKGTWDAMSLSKDREIRLSAYKRRLVESLSSSGWFVIISCNFTRNELCELFDDGSTLTFLCEIPATAAITFGGKQGVTSTGVVFKKS